MLDAIGVGSIDELFAEIPAELRLDRPLDLPPGCRRRECFDHLAALAERNAHADAELCFLGAGMYDHYVPAIVDAITQRSEFLTPYTPYQPEVSQGGLQVMFEFQTAISELCALPVANASLYEGPSSVASAAYLAIGATGRRRLVVSRGLHPHSRETLVTYARGFGAEVVEVGLEGGLTDAGELRRRWIGDTAALFVQNPNFLGAVEDLEALAAAASEAGALTVAAVDALTLGVLRPPGECGVDDRRRRGPAARGPARLRRPLVRLLLRHRGAPAPDAGPDRGGDGGRRRPARLRARPPDPRAAHPPREGRPTTSAPRRP